MSWLELSALVTPTTAQSLETILFACQAHAVSFEDQGNEPLYEPPLGAEPLWPQTLLKALFDEQEPGALLDQIALLWQIEFPSIALPEINYTLVVDQDWQKLTEKQFKPIKVTSNLWVIPSWHQAVDDQAINVKIEPGLAFGTGTHPTTLLCLQWLAQQSQDPNFKHQKVLDFGCGSGILACAAALLGAQHVDAIDIDPQALQASQHNAELNQLDAGVLNLYFPNQAPSIQYEVLIANILANTLLEQAAWLSHHLANQGKFALSGILPEQVEVIKKAYRAHQLVIDNQVAFFEGWILLSGTKN